MLLLACAGALSLASASAGAAEPGPDAASERHARELFQQGNALIERSRYVDALDRFQEAYALWQNPKIQLNIATTLRVLGRNAEALRAYREYLRDGKPRAELRAEVDEIMLELQTRVGRAVLQLPADVQKVTLDGRVLSDDALAELELDPGRHVVIAETTDGASAAAFDIVGGAVEQVVLPDPVAVRGHAAPADVSSAPPEPARSSVLGVLARLDIDGTGQGAVGAVGLSVAFGPRWRASLGGLLGAHAGGWGGVEWSILDGALTPTVGASMPVFFVDGPRFGASGELGGRWTLREDFLFVALRAAFVHFPRAPEGYAATVIVPSISTELRL
jgi:hypothetical protein